MADAALKIQAGFKGHQARKEVKAMKEAKDETEKDAAPTETEVTESSEYTLGYFGDPNVLESEQEDNTLSSAPFKETCPEGDDDAKRNETLDSNCSVKGSMESRVSLDEDDNTIKENLKTSNENSLKGDPVPIASNVVEVKPTNDAIKEANSSPQNDDAEAAPTEEDDLEDLFDDFTDSSISTSQPSANAPIRNKRAPFKLVKKLVSWINKPSGKVSPESGSRPQSGNESRNNSKDKSQGSKGSEKSLSLKKHSKVEPLDGE